MSRSLHSYKHLTRTTDNRASNPTLTKVRPSCKCPKGPVDIESSSSTCTRASSKHEFPRGPWVSSRPRDDDCSHVTNTSDATHARTQKEADTRNGRAQETARNNKSRVSFARESRVCSPDICLCGARARFSNETSTKVGTNWGTERRVDRERCEQRTEKRERDISSYHGHTGWILFSDISSFVYECSP